MRKMKRLLAALLTICLLCTVAPLTAMAFEDAEFATGTISVANYCPVDGRSKNKHFEALGIAVEDDGSAYLVLSSDNASASEGKEFTSVTLKEDGTDRTFAEDTLDAHIFYGKEMTLQLPNDPETGKPVTLTIGQRDDKKKTEALVFLYVGQAKDIKQFFVLDATCTSPGFSIEGLPVTVTPKYNIEKTVDKQIANLGDTLTYEITVENTGDYPVTNANVTDAIPACLENIKVSDITDKSNPQNIELKYDDEGKLLLKGPFIFMPGEKFIFEIQADIKQTFTGTEIMNVAFISGLSVISDDATIKTVIPGRFYIHHSADRNRVDEIEITESIAKNGFDVTNSTAYTTVDGKIYAGLTENTLYGGTFTDDGDGNFAEDDDVTNVDDYQTVYPFTGRDTGIGFVPTNNAHYFVWEPSTNYLQPKDLDIWLRNKSTNITDVVNVYLLTAVDRENYLNVGFDVEDVDPTDTNGTIEDTFVSSSEVYEKVYLRQNGNLLPNPYTTTSIYKLSGYLGCIELPTFDDYGMAVGGLFFNFHPYWITPDKVKVTGIVSRNAGYQGPNADHETGRWLAIENKEEVSTVEAVNFVSAIESLAVCAKFETSDTPSVPEVPAAPAPETVEVFYNAVKAGKSKNVKALDLSFSLTEFDYVDAYFMVNGDIRVDAADNNGEITARFSLEEMCNGEITILPCWTNADGETFQGTPLVLTYSNKRVK